MVEYFFTCPWCWQKISILVDEGTERFEGVEDCEVCCNPIAVEVVLEDGLVVRFRAEKAQ